MLLNGLLSVLNLVGRSNDDGAGYKASLLSGPPGIGKTTTAQIVCQVSLIHVSCFFVYFHFTAIFHVTLLTGSLFSYCICCKILGIIIVVFRESDVLRVT